jgi:hypothetical protein
MSFVCPHSPSTIQRLVFSWVPFGTPQPPRLTTPVPESDSGISFLKFPVSRHLLKLFYDELRSFSTFFALNFDKKLAVE